MKIAFTADTHLTTKREHPERFQAMKEVLHHCHELDADLLVIAGDLFDKTSSNYAAFEALYREHCPPKLVTHVIPGNHDMGLTEKALALDDFKIYTEPQLVNRGEDLSLLYLPYRDQATMGEDITPFAGELPAHQWLLIGHGDWVGGRKYPDPYEPGVYMPLTRTDLESYQPRHAILGHIHLPHEDDRVYYPGSPCPLNITETGMRRMLLYDSKSGEVRSHRVNSPVLYFQEEFLAVPMDDEIAYLEERINRRVDSWDLPNGWEEKVNLRVKILGYTRDRQAIKETVVNTLSSYKFYDRDGPDLSDLNQGMDPDRARIARDVKNWVDELDWPSGPKHPSREQILAQALKTIYGG